MMHKSPRIKSKALTDSARGQDCSLNVEGVCNYNSETTVLCHLASEDKGMSKKSHDFFGCYGCSDCHTWLDGASDDQDDYAFYVMRAWKRTVESWLRLDLIKIKGVKG